MNSPRNLRFNELFNNLHNLLTALLETSEKRDFYSCLIEIRERSKNSSLFRVIHTKYEDDLKTINSIRNILIHKNNWIDIPENTINFMEIIIGEMSQIEQSFHKTAVQIFGKKIFSAKDTDILSNILETMGNRNFSHIPVYTEKGNFRGVFSLKSLIFWMNAQKYLINKDITLAEISIDTKQSEYIFIKSNSKVTEIDEYFQEYSEKRKKL